MKDEEKLEKLRAKAQSKGATAADRKAFKAQQKKVQQARSAWRLEEEKAGRRPGPGNSGDGVAAPSTVAASTEVNQ